MKLSAGDRNLISLVFSLVAGVFIADLLIPIPLWIFGIEHDFNFRENDLLYLTGFFSAFFVIFPFLIFMTNKFLIKIFGDD